METSTRQSSDAETGLKSKKELKQERKMLLCCGRCHILLTSVTDFRKTNKMPSCQDNYSKSAFFLLVSLMAKVNTRCYIFVRHVTQQPLCVMFPSKTSHWKTENVRICAESAKRTCTNKPLNKNTAYNGSPLTSDSNPTVCSALLPVCGCKGMCV